MTEEQNTLEIFRNLDPAVLNAYYDALEDHYEPEEWDYDGFYHY